MAGAFRRKNADKIFKRLSKLGYKIAKSRPTNIRLWQLRHLRKKKKRNSENGQSRSLAFD
jgi:hypothetical protein